jgi:hypothetical protein
MRQIECRGAFTPTSATSWGLQPFRDASATGRGYNTTYSSSFQPNASRCALCLEGSIPTATTKRVCGELAPAGRRRRTIARPRLRWGAPKLAAPHGEQPAATQREPWLAQAVQKYGTGTVPSRQRRGGWRDWLSDPFTPACLSDTQNLAAAERMNP